MTYSPKVILLKNGAKITIRSAEISDAPQLIQTVKKYLADSEYIPQSSEEFTITIEQEEQWISTFTDRDNSLLLLAECDGQIIGNIDVTGHHRQMMEHTALIGMGLLTEFRNVGLGTQLMQEAIDWAKKNPLLEVLWLQVYTENLLGRALYNKMGFEENGVIKNFFKHSNRYYDNLTMSLAVK